MSWSQQSKLPAVPLITRKAGIFFTTYEGAKRFYSGLLSSSHLPEAAVHSLASGTAELASCLVLTPAEVIKQNAQMIRQGGSAGASRGSTSMQALRMIWQSEGGPVRRLLTGYTALIARNLPFTALQFPIFEAVRSRIWARRDRTLQSASLTTKDVAAGAGDVERRIQDKTLSGILETGIVTGVSAAISGSFAAVITTPTDVVKTRMMLAAAGNVGNDNGQAVMRQEHTAQAKDRRSSGGFQVARQVYGERGIRGLFRGGLLRAGWTALGSGLYLGTYEAAKVWLKGNKGAHDDDAF
jgi:hypothetical protein